MPLALAGCTKYLEKCDSGIKGQYGVCWVPITINGMVYYVKFTHNGFVCTFKEEMFVIALELINNLGPIVLLFLHLPKPVRLLLLGATYGVLFSQMRFPTASFYF